MIRLNSALSLIILVGVSLSACNKQSDSGASSVDLFGPRSSKPEAKFGTTFEKAYHADRNAQPLNVSEGDLPPRDPTAEPIDVPSRD